jgi:hypothetical protein
MAPVLGHSEMGRWVAKPIMASAWWVGWMNDRWWLMGDLRGLNNNPAIVGNFYSPPPPPQDYYKSLIFNDIKQLA